MNEVDAGVRSPAAGALLERRLRLRLVAIVAWSGFLGASPILLVWMGALPGYFETDLARISLAFLGAWACALIPATMATVLVAPMLRPS